MNFSPEIAVMELVRAPQQDSAQVVDSLAGFVPESPLPGGIADVVRSLFTLPQWFQIVGFIVGVIVAAIVAWRIWIHRAAIIRWIQTRSKNIKVAMGVTGALGVLGVAAFGMVSWDYMQHDKDFCSACHVMAGPFTRFDESEHAELTCHDCHRQTIFASARQLYLWVTERPVEIGEHSPVPDAICEECHVTDEHDHWQRVQLTAGHRTHYESDSTALDSLMCVTCHGEEVHRFVPVDQTCGQSGCHDNQVITLAGMENQTSLHCAACHRFVTEVPALATADSARGTTVPTLDQCNSCHEMQAALGDFDPALEPHGAQCGTCHNPHTQEASSDAAQSCTTSGCHDNWEVRPFHVGPSHVNVGEQCTMCHEPHASRVDPSDCVGCHTSVLQKDDVPAVIRDRLQRALPFDTTDALRSSALPLGPPMSGQPMSEGVGFRPVFWGIGAPIEAQPPWLAFALPQATPQDSFPHARHTELTCLNCHTTQSGHGSLTFEQPRGCQVCHHQAPQQADCAACHRSEDVNRPVAVTVSVTIQDSTTRRRQVDFFHDMHTTPACVDCHNEQVTLSVSPSVAMCAECHADHHVADRGCVACHLSDQVAEAHALPLDAHVKCFVCHDPSTVAALTPDHAFCLTCHQQQSVGHYEATGKECTTCHFLSEPEAFRSRVTGPGGSR